MAHVESVKYLVFLEILVGLSLKLCIFRCLCIFHHCMVESPFQQYHMNGLTSYWDDFKAAQVIFVGWSN